MKLESQVCTLEQAKKLKELGVQQESLFHWQDNELRYGLIESAFCDDKIMRCSVCCDDLNVSGTEIYCQCSKWTASEPMEPWKWGGFANGKLIPYAAFSCGELGVMLSGAGMYVNNVYLDLQRKWCYGDADEDPTFETEAEARAAMLIRLLKSELITVKEINDKL